MRVRARESYVSFLVETTYLVSSRQLIAPSVGDKLDFLLVRQNDGSEEADGGAADRRIEGDRDLISCLDPIRARGGDPGVGQDVGRTRRQLPHLRLTLRVLDCDVQRSVRVRKGKLLYDAR